MSVCGSPGQYLRRFSKTHIFLTHSNPLYSYGHTATRMPPNDTNPVALMEYILLML